MHFLFASVHFPLDFVRVGDRFVMQGSAQAFVDIAERTLIATLFGFLSYQLLFHYLAFGNISDLLGLASESAVVLLVLIRRPAKDISVRLQDWGLAFGATCASLLLRPSAAASFGPPQIGWLLQSLGLAAQLWCKAYLFRNFGVTPAIRGLAFKGPYQLVRHPMYASYFISQIGFLWAFPTLYNSAILAFWAGAQILRINAEERLLKKDALYRDYFSKVAWRLIPGLY